MKLRQISFKIVSMVMVLAMMFSICATTISAATLGETIDQVTDEIKDQGESIVDEIEDAYDEYAGPATEKFEEVIETIEALYAIAEMDPELAYMLVYMILEGEGVIEDLINAIDNAIEALDALNYELGEALDGADSALVHEVALTIENLYSLKTLANCFWFDEDFYGSIADLTASIAKHQENIEAIVAEANVVVDEYVAIAVDKVNEYLPVVVSVAELYIAIAEAAVVDYVLTYAAEAYEDLVDAVDALANVYAPATAEWIVEWFEENAESILFNIVIAGEDMVEFLDNNKVTILVLIGFVAGRYDQKIVNYVLDNAEKLVNTINGWVDAQGNTVWELVAFYFDAICACIDYDEEVDVIFNNIVDLLNQLNAELEANVNNDYANVEESLSNIESIINELVEQLQADCIEDANELGAYIYDYINDYVNQLLSANFTPTEDSYVVSVNGGKADYAKMLANALAEKLDVNSLKLGSTAWGNIDYDMLALADLITVGYDENELSAFAVAQLLAYVSDYTDSEIKPSIDEYIDDTFEKLNSLLYVIKEEKVDETIADLKAFVNASINEALTENGYVNLGNRDVAEMDWAKYVGEENVGYIYEAIDAIVDELVANGLIETVTVEINAVDILFENETIEEFLTKEKVAEVLGECGVYSFTLPVAEFVAFAIESYLYSFVEFQADYIDLLVNINEINPDAVVILLGHYNAFDVELTLGDVVVDLSEIYSYVAGVSGVSAYAYALAYPNAAFVDISGAETVYQSMVNAGQADGTLVDFALKYLMNSTITNVSAAGQKYIYEQIMGVLTVGCEHKYDNTCDATCNKCGYVRETIGHIYDGDCDIECNVCGERREGAGHKFNSVYCDAACVVCGAKRGNGQHRIADCTVGECIYCGYNVGASEHKYDNCNDVKCCKCDVVREFVGHTYTDCNDTTCNGCDATREALKHVYTNDCDATCNRCNEERTVADHVYSSCVDTNCNICDAERAAGTHTVDGCEGAVCTVCGYNVAAAGHKYGEWVTANGTQTKTCSVCAHKITKTIPVLPESGLPAGAVVGIVIGSIVVVDVAAFAIYWFVIQKKTFAQLLEVFNKNAEAGASKEKETK